MEKIENMIEPITIDIIERADDASMKVLMKYVELIGSKMNTEDIIKNVKVNYLK